MLLNYYNANKLQPSKEGKIKMKAWLDFFSSVHTSKGVYRQPKFNFYAFLKTGEGKYAAPKPTSGKPKKIELLKSNVASSNVCDKAEDADFIEKLKESLGFLSKGLPTGTTMRIAMNYAINLIKPDDGKEELWFQVLNYENQVLQVKLAQPPQKVKYLKEGNAIKPTLDKIEKFYFHET